MGFDLYNFDTMVGMFSPLLTPFPYITLSPTVGESSGNGDVFEEFMCGLSSILSVLGQAVHAPTGIARPDVYSRYPVSPR